MGRWHCAVFAVRFQSTENIFKGGNFVNFLVAVFKEIFSWVIDEALVWVRKLIHVFYMRSVFQSEAQMCLSFPQIEPQNMLKICLSKNIQKINFDDLTQALGEEFGRGYQNEEFLKFYLLHNYNH